MRNILPPLIVLLCLAITSCTNSPKPLVPKKTEGRGVAQSLYDSKEEDTLNESERIGREIWYKATAGNERFHTYTFPQRVLSGNIRWGLFFDAKKRNTRFSNWGLINDPDCCTPGTAGCAATSLDQTYGFDYCQGDDELLKYVGKVDGGYKDPSCDLKDVDGKPRQSACDLRFGTSTGVLGFRKFPNPRFDAVKWKNVNGGQMGTWDGFNKTPDDASIEPPFLIGTTCGSCHITFDPVKPPKDPNHPEWKNIKGTVGNQYMKNSVILGSGMPLDTLEWQSFKFERPGATDTSAVPNDSITNPGTINAIINIPTRPGAKGTQGFRENVTGYDRIPDCVPSKTEPGNCWQKTTKNMPVFHILKGGEDSIGAAGAVQRVYINIGSCAEECWLNHLTDFRVLDPGQRNFGQTPFNIAQCRADCANFRAIEDRVDNIFDFLASARPSDLHTAMNMSLPELRDTLEDHMHLKRGDIENVGKRVFVQQCAKCHSSEKNVNANTNFHELKDLSDSSLRKNWMGNDELTSVSEVGTYPNRALHTNHKQGHVWQNYSSNTYRAKNAPDVTLSSYADGGPGFYRNISLLSVWAFAPFLHNNALGPEICPIKAPDNYSFDFLSDCVPFPVSVTDRFRVFQSAMVELLTEPSKRPQKISKTDRAIRVPFMPVLSLNPFKPLPPSFIEFPEGLNVGYLGSMNLKGLVLDFIKYLNTPNEKLADWASSKFGENAAPMLKAFKETAQLLGSGKTLLKADRDRLNLYMKIYSNVPLSSSENQGHPFGIGLTMDEKMALIAFLATL